MNEQLEIHNTRFWHLPGRGGASIYGKEFEDEIHEDLKHSGE